MKDADQIAKVCLQQYESFGKGGAKPRIRQDGRFEWTVLAGIVLSINSEWHCIALATGVKSLPVSHLSKHGDLLHDSHAEVLARRAGRHWLLQRLLDETQSCRLHSIPRIFIMDEDSSTFSLSSEASFHLYCSTLPCGDLSSKLIVEDQEPGTDKEISSTSVLRGRNFSSSSHTHIRTKPGRPQAEPSISMSCSDKIACWTMMGFQGTLLYALIGKVYIQSYVVGDQAIISQKRTMESIQEILQKKCGGHRCIPQISFTGQTFPHSRESVQANLLAQRPNACISGPSDEQDLVPSANSVVWCLGAKPHGIVEGHRQGAALRRLAGEPLRTSSRSSICKLDWFRFFCDVQKRLSLGSLQGETYFVSKAGALNDRIQQYRKEKLILRGTDRLSDVDRLTYQKEANNAFLTQKAASRSWSIPTQAPFAGWLVNSHRVENFDIHGHLRDDVQ